MKEVTKRYGWNPATPDNGYYVINQQAVGAYIWEWSEPNEYPCFSNRTYNTISEALRGAAKDWDDSGSGDGLAKNMRIAAAHYEKAGQ